VKVEERHDHDYNGPAEWSLDAVQRRYRAHARRLGQRATQDLVVREHAHGSNRWTYPIMDAVIAGIRAGDRACVELGVEFIESDHRQAFGRTLHANTARALRQVSLEPDHVERLRARILKMLELGTVPREYQEYAKLIRTIGLGDDWPAIRQRLDGSNPYVMRYVRYFERHVGRDGA
jgi:hypothetical protein